MNGTRLPDRKMRGPARRWPDGDKPLLGYAFGVRTDAAMNNDSHEKEDARRQRRFTPQLEPNSAIGRRFPAGCTARLSKNRGLNHLSPGFCGFAGNKTETGRVKCGVRTSCPHAVGGGLIPVWQ
jgi:hypothetical protein